MSVKVPPRSMKNENWADILLYFGYKINNNFKHFIISLTIKAKTYFITIILKEQNLKTYKNR